MCVHGNEVAGRRDIGRSVILSFIKSGDWAGIMKVAAEKAPVINIKDNGGFGCNEDLWLKDFFVPAPV